MTLGTCIGDDRREAIDWLQDRLKTTRPAAERAMIGLLSEGKAVTTDAGIFLTEAEDEVEKNAAVKVSQSMRTSPRSSSRSRFRHSWSAETGVRIKERCDDHILPKTVGVKSEAQDEEDDAVH